jgi:hypothetical protein
MDAMMQYNALKIMLQHSNACGAVAFNMQDIAALKCVSKELQCLVTKHIDDALLIISTANDVDIPYAKLMSDHCLDTTMLLQQLLIIKRLHGNQAKVQQLVNVLNAFTRDITSGIWTESFKGMSRETQFYTIDFLAHCNCEGNLGHNIVIVYLLMTFMAKFLNNNRAILDDRKQTVFAGQRFRDVMVCKCTHLTSTLREEVTAYPYMFVDRVLRKIGDVRRFVQKL